VIARVDRALAHASQVTLTAQVMEIKPMSSPDVPQSHAEVLKQLERAASQLQRAGERIEAGRSFLDVTEQLYVAERAVREAKKMFINDHLDHCLDHAVDSTSPEARASVDEFKIIAKYL
jgi:DNA-binding FrmR family transcriptional regulator